MRFKIIKQTYFFIVFFILAIPVICSGQSFTIPDIGVSDLNEGQRTTLVTTLVRYVIKCFPLTAAFYDVMCWLCLFITAALGIKQLFVKSDEDRGGGFWNVLKVAGWGIAGLLGIIVKNSLGNCPTSSAG